MRTLSSASKRKRAALEAGAARYTCYKGYIPIQLDCYLQGIVALP